MNDTDTELTYAVLRADDLRNRIRNIEELIASLGTHPSFTLPPVSEFITKLKELIKDGE